MIINYIKNISYFFINLLIYNLIITIFNYIGLLSSSIKIISIIYLLLSSLIVGYIIGSKATKKGYLEGIKLSSIIIIFIIVFNLILGNKLKFISIIYYLLILLFTTTGSILGIHKKR